MLTKKGKTNIIPKLKLPKVKTFSEHTAECKPCSRVFKDKSTRRRKSKMQRVSDHYQKYLKRRIKRLAAYLAYHGISFRRDYIVGWEE